MDSDKLLVFKVPKFLGEGYGFMHTQLKFMMRFQKSSNLIIHALHPLHDLVCRIQWRLSLPF